MTGPNLRFSVDTHIFRELGELLVGRDSTALLELIKNSYDADATRIVVTAVDLKRARPRAYHHRRQRLRYGRVAIRERVPADRLPVQGRRRASLGFFPTAIYRIKGHRLNSPRTN